MIAVRERDVRTNFRKYFDMAFSGKIVIVSREENRNVVIISEAEYNELKRAKKNVEYLEKLNRADKQIKNEQVVTKTMDELNRAILIIHKVRPKVAKNLEDNEDKNTVILQLDNDDYLCIFGAYVRRATYSTRPVENVPEDTTAEVILLSASMIKGKRIFTEKDRFKKLRFEITSGHELIGKQDAGNPHGSSVFCVFGVSFLDDGNQRILRKSWLSGLIHNGRGIDF